MLENVNETGRVELSSGEIVIIDRIKGKHIAKAGQIMGGDQSKYMFALMHLCAYVGGQLQPLEYFEELDAADFMAIQEELSKQFEGKNP